MSYEGRDENEFCQNGEQLEFESLPVAIMIDQITSK